MEKVVAYIERLRCLGVSRKNQDYLKTWEYTRAELEAVVCVARTLEELHALNISCKAFQSGLAVANFRDKSTRTRLAFDSAVSLLGLQCTNFDEALSQVGHGETTRETAAMLSFLTEVVGIRDDLYLHEGSKYMEDTAASIQESFDEAVLPQRPTVVNLQCDQDHPTQSMSDLLHLMEHFSSTDNDGKTKMSSSMEQELASLKGKTIAVSWTYSPSYGKPLSVPQGLITLLTRFGMHVRLAHPPGYSLLPHTLDKAENFAKNETGGVGSFTTFDNMEDCFRGADVVYPKSWAPFTVMEERTRLLRSKASSAKEDLKALESKCLENNAKYKNWTCTEALMALTKEGKTGRNQGKEALYMHCLPADISGVSCEMGEVEASVFDRYRLRTYKEASHKPYIIASAILLNRFDDTASVLTELAKRATPNRMEVIESKSAFELAQERTQQKNREGGGGGRGGCVASLPPAPVPAFTKVSQRPCDEVGRFQGITWPTGLPITELDQEIVRLSAKYQPLACELLKEAIRIPADHIKVDPQCGMSNHEKPRLDYLKAMIILHKAVEKAEDVGFDEFGSLLWTVTDRQEIEKVKGEKAVIYFDGHTDTVNPLPQEWQRKIGEGGIDVYTGVMDKSKANVDFLKHELGYIPPKSEWEHLIFGRGSADQLSGVVQQIVATKIMLELKNKGALKGVVIRSYATIAEEDNDGGTPMFVMRNVIPQHPEYIPDVVLHTEGTGDINSSACGIYTGQRGRMQIQVEVVGQSSHGSMPWMGLNPLEFGAAIITEARLKMDRFIDVGYDSFLGQGTRTASWCKLDTPSDCAVPAAFVFRFDRRITAGETAEGCMQAVEGLEAVKRAREAGLTVLITIPSYSTPTWKGTLPGNQQLYPGWDTPPDHPAVAAAVEAWKRVVTHGLLKDAPENDPTDPQNFSKIPKQPRVSRWIFSTDGVGYPLPKAPDKAPFPVPASKQWIDCQQGSHHHPAQLGMGIGYEQNTHKVGEFIDARHFPAAIAFVARFPTLYAASKGKQ